MVEILYDSASVSPDSLAADDVTQVAFTRFDAARERGFRVSKIECWASWSGPDTAVEGMVAVGIAVGLSAAEVEAAIESDPQGNGQGGDKTLMEIAKRPIWPIGCFNSNMVTGSDRPPLHKVFKLNWSVQEGNFMMFWIFNVGPTALPANAGNIQFFVKYYGVWLND